MVFAGISKAAVITAAVGGFLFGGIWYGMFSQVWLAATGLDEKEIKKAGWERNALPFILSFAGLLVMAYVLAGIIGHLGPGQVTVRNGLITAAFVWVGFIVTTHTINHAFQGARPVLTFIDCGHWLGVLLIQGAIIGLIGI